jgi:hypothetical protein
MESVPYLLGSGESVLFRELLATADGLGQSPYPHWLTVFTPTQPVEPGAAREDNEDEACGSRGLTYLVLAPKAPSSSDRDIPVSSPMCSMPNALFNWAPNLPPR